MFDTHCHLNFSRFKKNLDDVIQRAKDAGVMSMVIPGTDIESSKKAVEIAEKHDGVYAAVGIHPHHVFPVNNGEYLNNSNYLSDISQLLSHPKVVAIGEIGLDYHVYKETKYESYNLSDEFKKLQKEIFEEQLKLACNSRKSIIIHNREAADDVLHSLQNFWLESMSGRTVFHCCEPNKKLLEFAKLHRVMIGVDGDVTYDRAKQDFIKEVPLELLVVETDSPFLLPEPLRSRKEFPNEPKNLSYIVGTVAVLKNLTTRAVENQTNINAQILFTL